MAPPRLDLEKVTGLPSKEQKHPQSCRKAPVIWKWSNLSCTAVLKDKLSDQFFPITTSSGKNLSPGFCWKMHKVLEQLLQCLTAKGAFHLPPQLETMTPTARGWLFCTFLCRLFCVVPASPGWEVTALVTVGWDVVVLWGQAGEHHVGTVTWPTPYIRVFCPKRHLIAHQWHDSGTKQVRLIALTPLPSSAWEVVNEGFVK